MKNKLFVGVVLVFLLAGVAGAATFFTVPDNPTTPTSTEQDTHPRPASLLLFGTSLVGMMSLVSLKSL